MQGFKLEFHFASNVFFTDTVLTKEYTMEDDEDPVLLKVEVLFCFLRSVVPTAGQGCEIHWNPGKSTCFKLMKKKQKSGFASLFVVLIQTIFFVCRKEIQGGDQARAVP